MGVTLNERFIEIVERRGEHTAFMVKREGSWQSFSFDWGLEQAAKTAFGLMSLGYETGSRIAILSENTGVGDHGLRRHGGRAGRRSPLHHLDP